MTRGSLITLNLIKSCKVNSVVLPDGSTWKTGVLVEKCKYLEESKCVGICINTCKLLTQDEQLEALLKLVSLIITNSLRALTK
ncbi:hypothetical protein AQUCO_04300013v1 [Aquilegia coerulea]|uniref:Beta-carotene isomerase D27-like C-terminal domain-containing protein n=1 Tax=Aquilegia coerulea TaxID=218851 RepID=A0A2G5CNC1_AQUCA|nr:hypothetical protein AQUCO_04300013v1 [Aquilegia coerulea]